VTASNLYVEGNKMKRNSLSPCGRFVCFTAPAMKPNLSIEQTALSQLRWPKSAAHVER
jgi:hypothetical protein